MPKAHCGVTLQSAPGPLTAQAIAARRLSAQLQGGSQHRAM